MAELAEVARGALTLPMEVYGVDDPLPVKVDCALIEPADDHDGMAFAIDFPAGSEAEVEAVRSALASKLGLDARTAIELIAA